MNRFEARAIDNQGFVDPSPASEQWPIAVMTPQTANTESPIASTDSRGANSVFSEAANWGYSIGWEVGAIIPMLNEGRQLRPEMIWDRYLCDTRIGNRLFRKVCAGDFTLHKLDVKKAALIHFDLAAGLIGINYATQHPSLIRHRLLVAYLRAAGPQIGDKGNGMASPMSAQIRLSLYGRLRIFVRAELSLESNQI